MQQQIWDAAAHLQPFFVGGRTNGNWRNLDNLFKSEADCPTSSPGTVNISPGWFEQAHDVRIIYLF
jgi:hypothetical protein